MRRDQVLSDAIEALKSEHWVDMRGNVGFTKPMFDSILLKLETVLSDPHWYDSENEIISSPEAVSGASSKNNGKID